MIVPVRRRLPCDEILSIARRDAEPVYRDLSRFQIRIVEEPDGWHIDYELKDQHACGGGPHYVIDSTSGEIIAKRYEQ